MFSLYIRGVRAKQSMIDTELHLTEESISPGGLGLALRSLYARTVTLLRVMGLSYKKSLNVTA